LHIQSGIKLKDAVSAVKQRLVRKDYYDRVLVISKGGKFVEIWRKDLI